MYVNGEDGLTTCLMCGGVGRYLGNPDNADCEDCKGTGRVDEWTHLRQDKDLYDAQCLLADMREAQREMDGGY